MKEEQKQFYQSKPQKYYPFNISSIRSSIYKRNFHYQQKMILKSSGLKSSLVNLPSDKCKVGMKNIKTPVKINKFAKTHLILSVPSVFVLLFDSFL
jgi:hypothetical protein